MADIYKFCEEIILGPGDLHSFEYHEVATPNVDRDVAVACWVIQAELDRLQVKIGNYDTITQN